MIRIQYMRMAAITPNRYDVLQISHIERIENKTLNWPGYRCSKEHNDCNRDTHARCLIKLFGYSEEGTYAEEAAEHVVIDKYCR